MIVIFAFMYSLKLLFKVSIWVFLPKLLPTHPESITLPPIRTIQEFPTGIKTKSRRLFYSTELVFLLVELVLCLILLVPAFFVELNVQSVFTMVLVLLWLVWSCVIGPLRTVIHTPMQRKTIKKLYLQIKKVFSCRKLKQVDLSNEPLINNIENRTIINELKAGSAEQLIETGNIGMEFQDHSDHNKLKTPLILSSQHGNTNLVKTLLQAGAEVDQVVEGDLITALEYACFYGHDSMVKVLLKNGSKPNGIDKYGKATGIPLAEAVKRHHGNIVKMLLLHGADPNMDDCHLRATPMKWVTQELQYSQRWWSFRNDSMYICELLVKAGARLLSAINVAHLRVLSFYTRKSVVVIGNSHHGKTTLVASLRNEDRCLKKLVNRIQKMNIITERTAGIDTVPFDSKKYGRVLFFDFAGHEAYHGPHQAFLRALFPRPGVSLSFLMLVKSTDSESTILSQLKRWLQPLISIPNVPENVKVKVILVGSFADQLTVAKSEIITMLQRCLDQIEGRDQKWLEFSKPCVLDCRYSESAGIDYLRDQINSVTSYEQSSIETGYNLHWVVTLIKESFKQLGPAFQIKKFKLRIQTLEKRNDLPINLPSADQIYRDLAAAGHALHFPNEEDPDESWLVFDIPTVLNEIYGKLFSHFINNENSQTKYGLINRHDLHSLIPKYDNLICNLLIDLEICLKVDKNLLKEVELLVNTANEAQNEWLFFPSFTRSQKPDQVFKEDQRFKVYICWQVHTINDQTLSPIVHQTILLCLAAHYVFKHETSVGYYCSLWCNGITWSNNIKGIEVAVQIADQSLIQVACRGLCEAEKVLAYLSQIAQDILKTCSSFKTEVGAYIIHHPDMPAVSNDPKLASKKNMYPASSICTSRECILSLPHEEDHVPPPVAMSDVFGCIPQLEVLQQLMAVTIPGPSSQPKGNSICNK